MTVEDDPRQALAARLRELHLEAGRPSVTRLVALTSALHNRIPRSTIQDKLRGKSAPTFDQLLTIVRACLRHAIEHDIAVAEFWSAQDYWRDLWREIQKQTAPASPGAPVPAAPAPPQVLDPGLAAITSRGPAGETQPPDRETVTDPEFERGRTDGSRFIQSLPEEAVSDIEAAGFDLFRWAASIHSTKSPWKSRVDRYLGKYVSVGAGIRPRRAYVEGLAVGAREYRETRSASAATASPLTPVPLPWQASEEVQLWLERQRKVDSSLYPFLSGVRNIATILVSAHNADVRRDELAVRERNEGFIGNGAGHPFLFVLRQESRPLVVDRPIAVTFDFDEDATGAQIVIYDSNGNLSERLCMSLGIVSVNDLASGIERQPSIEDEAGMKRWLRTGIERLTR